MNCSPPLPTAAPRHVRERIYAELLVELVQAGLVSAHAERRVANGKMKEAARVKISEAGWQALAGDATNGRAKST